jgi:MFS family permease
MYLSAPFIFGAFKRWPNLRRPSVLVGLLIMTTALAVSSFSQTVTQLIVTQGILYAVGGALTYSATILFLDEWFIRKKGFAYGVMWAGSGVAGVVLPLVIQWLLRDYGFRTALRAWCLALFILTMPLLYFVKERVPISHASEDDRRARKLFDLSFLLNTEFMILQFCNTIEALGYFLPAIYLPTFAQQTLHSSPLAAALTVICVNVASVFGCIFMGAFIDRFHVTTCAMISSVGATIGIFLFWGLATNLPLLYVFCIIYGFFAGSFSTTWAGIIQHIRSRVESADAGLIFAFLAFGRGLGNVCSGPLSEALIKGNPWVQETAMAYGTGFGPLITFTGISALLGGCSFLVRRVGYL